MVPSETDFEPAHDIFEELEKHTVARREFEKKHPILAKLDRAWSNFINPGPLWWFKYRFVPTHQYHIVRTSLKPGYHDPRTRILYAVFEELDAWANRDWHTDGYIVSGRILIPKDIVGNRSGVSYETGEPATQADIEYYLSRKDMLDDLREAYLWWIKTNKDPDRWIEEQCWGDSRRADLESPVELEDELEEEAGRMLVKVVSHYRNLWN